MMMMMKQINVTVWRTLTKLNLTWLSSFKTKNVMIIKREEWWAGKRKKHSVRRVWWVSCWWMNEGGCLSCDALVKRRLVHLSSPIWIWAGSIAAQKRWPIGGCRGPHGRVTVANLPISDLTADLSQPNRSDHWSARIQWSAANFRANDLTFYSTHRKSMTTSRQVLVNIFPSFHSGDYLKMVIIGIHRPWPC